MNYLAFTGMSAEYEGIDHLLEAWDLGRCGNVIALPCYLNHVAGRNVAETDHHSES